MDAGPDLRLGVLWPHGAAPDLGVVEEEQLVVGHVETRQVRFLSMQLNPFLVSSVGLDQNKAVKIAENFQFCAGRRESAIVNLFLVKVNYISCISTLKSFYICTAFLCISQQNVSLPK